MKIDELNSKPHQKSITVTMSYDDARDISNGLYYLVSGENPDDRSKYQPIYADCKMLFDMIKHGNVQPETIAYKSSLLNNEKVKAEKPEIDKIVTTGNGKKQDVKKTMTVQEYNKEFLPKIDKASCVIANMENDLRKTDDYEGAMRELTVLGWSEETKKLILTALDYYRQHEGIDKIKLLD